jgi:hypothetical protein
MKKNRRPLNINSIERPQLETVSGRFSFGSDCLSEHRMHGLLDFPAYF